MRYRNQSVLVLIVVAAITSSTACGASSTHGGLPAAVTLQGVGGIRIGMSAAQVARMLHAETLAVFEGSSEWTYTAICAGKMQGVAGFFGPGEDNPLVGDVNSLEWMWFRAGAKTDRGVGVGSSRADVVRAYVKRLHRPAVPGDLYVVGQPTQIFSNSFVKPVLYFAFTAKNVVSALGYGARQQVLGEDAVAAQEFC
jgi:hypothetical protein